MAQGLRERFGPGGPSALALIRAGTSASFAPFPMAASTTTRRHTFSGPSPEEAMVRDLIELLEAGSTPWRRPWDSRGGGVHINLLSGRAYRGGNPILLELGMAMRGAELPFWCGFAEAKKLGLFPRKGSKSVRILRPQLQSSEKEGSDGQPVLRSWARYRPVPVFNACDLEGEALAALIEARLPQVEPRAPLERIEQAEQVLQAWEVPVGWGGEKAFYAPGADRIQLPEREAFHSPAGLYATWVPPSQLRDSAGLGSGRTFTPPDFPRCLQGVTRWNRDLHWGSGWLRGHYCGWRTSQPNISNEAAVIQLPPTRRPIASQRGCGGARACASSMLNTAIATVSPRRAAIAPE